MTLPDGLTDALRRLDSALSSLEVATARGAGGEIERGDADEAFAALEGDRVRLALELDAALARVKALDQAAEAVSVRLEQAGATVRTVLAELEAVPPGVGPG